jgi:O-antigen ligase
MIAATGQIFDTAHNEYLQYLLTIGPIALIAYLIFLINSCQHMARYVLKALTTESTAVPYAIGCLFAVICYSFQAFVNLNLPIITPFLWITLSMGIATVKKYTVHKVK